MSDDCPQRRNTDGVAPVEYDIIAQKAAEAAVKQMQNHCPCGLERDTCMKREIFVDELIDTMKRAKDARWKYGVTILIMLTGAGFGLFLLGVKTKLNGG